MQKNRNKYWQGIGRRKRATALVKMSVGSGMITINKNNIDLPDLVYLEPLKIAGWVKSVDISAVCRGGGFSSQKQALRLAIARAIIDKDDSFKSTFRKAGFLTRDPREKERKKPGLKRARRAPQWAKR